MKLPRLCAVHECFALLLDGEEDAAAARHPPDIIEEARRILDADRTLDANDTPAPCAQDEHTNLVGTSIAGFELVGFLGAGANGQVYLARQSRPDRLVAFKLLWPCTRVEARDAEREIAALASLEHQGIARLYQAGTWECGGSFRTWLAMEHVDGARPLDASLMKSMSLHERVSLLADLADAIAYAHGCGIIHRDLKPANVLVDARGRAVVIDFGLARRETTATGRTLTMLGERVVGTLGYMAPESLEQGRALDARADIFSLGAIAYDLFAGAPMRPLDGGTVAQALATIQSSVPKRLGAIDSRLRGDLDRIVAKATESDPSRRYAGAALFAHDLRQHLIGLPVLIEQQRLRERVTRSVRRHWRLTVALTTCTLVLIATTLISLRFAHETAAQARRAALAAAASAIEANDQLAFGQAIGALDDDGSSEVALLKRARVCRGEPVESGNWYAVVSNSDRTWIAGVVQHTGSPQLVRLEGLKCKWSTAVGEVSVGGVAISPDGRFIAVAENDGSLLIVAGNDGRVLHEVAPIPGEEGGDVAWRDATTVVHAVHSARIVEAITGEVQRVSGDIGIGETRSIARPHMGGFILAAEAGACVIDDNLEVTQQLETPPYRQSAAASLVDGSVVLGGWDRTVRRYRSGSSTPLWTGRAHRDIIWSIGVLSDGRICSTGADGMLVIWDADTGAPTVMPVSDVMSWSVVVMDDAVLVGGVPGLRRIPLEDLEAWVGTPGISPTTVTSAQWSASVDAEGRVAVKSGGGSAGEHDVSCAALAGRRLQKLASTNDPRWLVAVDSAGEVNAFDALTGALLWRTGVVSHDDDHEPGGIAAIAVDAARGRVVLASRHDGCVVLSLADGSVQWKRQVDEQSACVGVSPVDGTIITGGRHGLLVRLDPRDGAVRASARHQRTRPIRIVFTKDGTRAVVAGSDGSLRLVDSTTLEESLALRVSSAPLDALWIADDGVWTVDREGVKRRR